MTHFLLYGLLLALIKYFISQNFKSLNHKEKLKHVLKLMIISEVDGDCHTVKWKLEMLLLSLMQIASDLILLVPFFVTGKKCFRFQLLLTLTSSFFISSSTGSTIRNWQKVKTWLDQMFWQIYQKLMLSGFLSSGNLCLIHHLKLFWPHVASTAPDRKGAKIQHEFSWFCQKRFFFKTSK